MKFYSINIYNKMSNSTISESVTINNADISSYSWPVKVQGGTSSSPVIVTFGDDITFIYSSQYFIIGSEYVTINGSNNSVTINNVSSYNGLVQNGSIGDNGYSNTTVENIYMDSSNNATLADNGGWICQEYFAYGALNNVITNCHTSGYIGASNTGGICGQYAGGNSGTITVTNCSSTGAITGTY